MVITGLISGLKYAPVFLQCVSYMFKCISVPIYSFHTYKAEMLQESFNLVQYTGGTLLAFI